MRAIRNFDEFVKEGIVKRVSVNGERAKSLIKEADRKMNSLKERLGKIGIKEDNANDYVEYCYDILLILIRAKMLLRGYNSSGQGAHEAEVAYAKLLGFSEKDVQFLDQMRFFRNGMLYYGTVLDKVYAEKSIEFLNRLYFVLVREDK